MGDQKRTYPTYTWRIYLEAYDFAIHALKNDPCVVVHTFHPITEETEVGKSLWI